MTKTWKVLTEFGGYRVVTISGDENYKVTLEEQFIKNGKISTMSAVLIHEQTALELGMDWLSETHSGWELLENDV